MRISKTFRFEAAHRLPKHPGKCSRHHGHSYVLEVEISGPFHLNEQGDGGMVMDFADLKGIVQSEILDRFDHKDLNAEVALIWPSRPNAEEINITTAEFLCKMFAQILRDKIERVKPNISLTRVRLWETATSWAEWDVTDIYDGKL